jgi:hypothetical protein
MTILFMAVFIIVLAVPLVLCLHAMGQQIRADFERGQPDRIATDIPMQRRILIVVSAFVLASSMLGHWLIGLTALLTVLAFLIPYWRNRPLNDADGPAVD